MSNFFKNIIPSKNDGKSEKTRKIVLLTACALFLACVIVFAVYYIDYIRKERLKDELIAIHEASTTLNVVTTTEAPPSETETEASETEPPPPPPLIMRENIAPILEMNPDTAGWVKVPGTSVNYAVLQTVDNDYYLERDFNEKKSKGGTIYADFRCNVNDYDFNQSDNIVIYGHNQADGTMFGTLKNYKIKSTDTRNFSFYLENPTFEFSNLYEDYTYKIIALFIIEVEPYQVRDGDIFDYHNFVNFNPDSEERSFEVFKEEIMERTQIFTDVDFDENDKYVTLSTCSNEFEPSRFVVIGRRLREGEDPSVDTSKATINENALEPDLDFIYGR